MRIHLFLIQILLSTSLFPQFQPDFKSLSQKEIEYNIVEFEPEADAVILERIGQITVKNYGYEIKEKCRIKILNEDGLKYAQQKWFYNPMYPKSNINLVHAETINIENENIEISKVKNKYIKKTKLTEDNASFTVNFPNAKVGSIIEYEVIIRQPNILFRYPWTFTKEIPSLETRVEFINESPNDYDIILHGEKLTNKYKGDENGASVSLENILSKKSNPKNLEQIEIIIKNL